MYFLWTAAVLSLDAQRKYQRKAPLFRRSGPTTKGLLAPWNPDFVGRGRAGLKNRQDTFFDAPPTRSRLTAPPIIFLCNRKVFPLEKGSVCRKSPFWGSNVGMGLDPSSPSAARSVWFVPQAQTPPYLLSFIYYLLSANHRRFADTPTLHS